MGNVKLLSWVLILASVNINGAAGVFFTARHAARAQDSPESSALVRELPPSEKRYALIIGVSRYADEGISQLVAPTNDADQLSEALTMHAGFPKGHVVVLATNKPEGQQPQRNTVIRYISTLAKEAGEDGLFLLAFSGHGYEVDGQSFLLGSDAQLVPELAVIKMTCLGWSEIMGLIEDANVGQVMMLLDACRNDPRSSKGIGETNQITQIYERSLTLKKQQRGKKAFLKMLATQKGEYAYEDGSKKLGFFMSAFIEGIRGRAADKTGKVTLANLCQYVKKEVPSRAKIRGRSQTPFIEMASYDEDNLVIATSPGGDTERLANTPENRTLVELEDWERIKDSRRIQDFESFLRMHSDGQFAELARYKIKEIEEATKPNVAADPTPATATSNPLVKRGDDLLASKNYAQAEQEYRAAIKMDSNQAEYYGKLGIALYQQRKFKEAEAEYRKAIKIDRYSPQWFFNLGLTLYMQQRYADAEEEFRKAIARNSNEAGFHASLGNVLYLQKEWVEAELAFRQAIKLRQDNASYHNSLANVLVLQRKFNQAMVEYRTAIQLDPANSVYKQSLQDLKRILGN